jgi:hypothetical protein
MNVPRVYSRNVIAMGDTASGWTRVVDTSLDSPDDFAAAGDEADIREPYHALKSRSVVVLAGGT